MTEEKPSAVEVKACQLHGGYIGQTVSVVPWGETILAGKLTAFEMRLESQRSGSGSPLVVVRLDIGGLTVDVPGNRSMLLKGHEEPIPVPESVFAEG